MVKGLISGSSLRPWHNIDHDTSNVAAGRNGGGWSHTESLQLGADSSTTAAWSCLKCQPLISPFLSADSVQSH